MIDAILLTVFVIHLLVFARLLALRGKRYLAPTVSFVLLVAAYSLRVLSPDLSMVGYNVATVLRLAAWTALGVSALLLMRRWMGARRQEQAGED